MPQPSASEESTSLPSVTHASSPTLTTVSQATATSLPRSSPTPVPDLPVPNTSIDSSADTSNLDVTLLATEIGVHQAAVAPQVVQEHLVTSGNLDTIAPSELVVNPSQFVAEASQPIAELSQSVVDPPQSIAEPSQVIAELSQSVPGRLNVSTEVAPMDVQVDSTIIPVPGRSDVSTEVVPMDVQVDSTVIPVPSHLLTKVVGATSNGPTPKVSYRVRNPAAMPSGKPSRRDSIDGAPEMIDVDQELIVDLRDYINIELDDGRSQVSSSQKTADDCEELSPPPPDSQ